MGYPRCFEDIKEICERIGAFQDPKVCCPFIIFIIILACLAHCYVKLDGAAGGPDANFGENASLTESFWSTQYQTSLLLASIIAIPMALDLVVDAFGLDRRNSVQMVTWFAKVVFVTSLTVPNLLTYLGTFRQNDSLGAHHCMIMYVKVAAHGCICILISELNQRRGTAYLCMTAVLCYTAATHLYIRLQVDHDPALQYAPIIFYTLTYCQLIYIFFQWIFYWIFEGRKMDSDDVCFIIYFTGLLVISVGDFIITTTTQGHYTPTSLSMQNYLFMLLLLIIMACPGQIVRFNLRKVLRKMEEKEAFIRYISHEIRTPLNTVFLGMSYIKGELMGIAPLVSEYVEPILDTVNEVNNCCEVALSIVNDLLTFDKLEEGKMNLELKETDVKQYLTETVRPFDIQARDKDISITFAVDGLDLECDQAKVLRVDQHKMSQVIRNLVSNALKFTPPDGTIVITLSKVKVHVASARRGSFVRGSTLSHPKVAAKTKFTRYLKKLSNNYITQLKSGLKKKNSYRGPGGIRARSATGVRGELHVDYLRIEVTDSGAGISEENQKRLFGQYVQFNAGKLQEGNGSGLGLWISKGITELHGGCIGAYSKGEGKGSTFYLELPLFPKEAVIGLDDLPRGRQSLLLSAKMRRYDRYDNPGFGMHPKGSGFNSNISLADLISLDRKIRSRAGSSDYIFNSEISESRNISGRTSLGRIDLPPFGLSDSLKSSKNSGHSGISKAVDGKISFSSFFHRDSARVGCFIDEIDESLLEAGMRRKSGSGPYVKRRGSSFTVSESLKVFRVLVVDDSVPTRKLMHRVLSRKGYEVTCAEDGLDCLDIIYPSSAIEDSSDSNLADLYDIVIMDDNMPKMSGRDVAKTLRLKGFKGMICGVTGNTSPEDESSFIISGADLVFPKPLDFDLFEKTIRTHPRLVELLLNQVQAQGQGRGHSQGSVQGMSQGLGMSQRTGLGLGPSLRNSFDGGVLGQSLVLGQYRGPAPSPGPGSVHIPGPLVFPDYDPGPFPSFSIMGLESSV